MSLFVLFPSMYLLVQQHSPLLIIVTIFYVCCAIPSYLSWHFTETSCLVRYECLFKCACPSLRYTLCNVEGNSACSRFHRDTNLLTPRFYHSITCPPLTKKWFPFPLLPLYYCAAQCPIIWYCPPFFKSNSFRWTMSAPKFHIHRNIFQKFVVNFSLVRVHTYIVQ